MCFASLSASVLPGQSFTLGCLNNRAGTWYYPLLPVDLAECSPFPQWHLLQHHTASIWRLFAEMDWKQECRLGYHLQQHAQLSNSFLCDWCKATLLVEWMLFCYQQQCWDWSKMTKHDIVCVGCKSIHKDPSFPKEWCVNLNAFERRRNF